MLMYLILGFNLCRLQSIEKCFTAFVNLRGTILKKNTTILMIFLLFFSILLLCCSNNALISDLCNCYTQKSDNLEV